MGCLRRLLCVALVVAAWTAKPVQAQFKIVKSNSNSNQAAMAALVALQEELDASDSGTTFEGRADKQRDREIQMDDDSDEEEGEVDDGTPEDRLVVVVGSGRTVLGSDLGSKIDKFKTVVRVGPFSTRGFEQDVGTKTHYWFLSQDEPPVRTLLAEEALSLKELVVPIVFHPCNTAGPDSVCRLTPTQSKLLSRTQDASKKNVRRRFFPALQNAPKEKRSEHTAFGEHTYYEDQVKFRVEKLKETDLLYERYKLEEPVPSLNLVALNYFLARNPRAKVAYVGFDFDASVYWERASGGAAAALKAVATCENTNDEARVIREWEAQGRVYRLSNKEGKAELLPTPVECKASGKLSAKAAEEDKAREGRKDRKKQRDGKDGAKAGTASRRRPTRRPPAASARGAESRRGRAGGDARKEAQPATLLDDWNENTDNR